MLLQSIFLVTFCAGVSHSVLYDHYTGKPLSWCQLEFYESVNKTSTCTLEIEDCDEYEWRRIDGTCNNLRYPARGTSFSPMLRLLPARFYNSNYERKAVSGEELPSPREVRLTLLKHVKTSHELFNNNVPGFGISMFTDIGSAHDNINLLTVTTYCCEEEHMNDFECTPNIILDSDPVFKCTDIRCMNSTRPLTYQYYNCTKDPVPAPLNNSTSAFDNSHIYNPLNRGDQPIRSFVKGQLSVEEVDGKIYPPNGPTASCTSNQAPTETVCFQNYPSTLLPNALFTVWLVRFHNYVANELAQVNPCWDDERLFQETREICIAYTHKLYFFDWLSVLQGRENLIKARLINEDDGFRDLYDDNFYPQVTLEYVYIIRFFHLFQESRAELYDKNGTYVEENSVLHMIRRMGYIANHIEELTQSTYRAGCHGGYGTVDFDMANFAMPALQKAIDVPTGDINKGRNFGLPPYADYVEYLSGIPINCFEDLAPFIPAKKIKILKKLYGNVRDIDLMAGAWCEKNIEGGHIPLIVANILNDNFFRVLRSDRFWFERPDRAHAFDAVQLKEIKTKASLELLMCTCADGVTEIPKNAFLKISETNPLVSCDTISLMDFTAWADCACNDA